jgi:hypothetical protein
MNFTGFPKCVGLDTGKATSYQGLLDFLIIGTPGGFGFEQARERLKEISSNVIYRWRLLDIRYRTVLYDELAPWLQNPKEFGEILVILIDMVNHRTFQYEVVHCILKPGGHHRALLK